MRLAIIGASAVGEATARDLIDHGHDVVIVEKDRARIDDLSGSLDAGFIHGDGSKPRILKEVGAKDTDVLISLGDDDQDNILTSLVGRSLGFAMQVTKISDPELEHICVELGLDHTISADHTTARSIVDTVEGRNLVDLATILRGKVRFFIFTAKEEESGDPADLPLPNGTEVLFFYRGERLCLPSKGHKLQKDDDVVLLTSTEEIDELSKRWGGK